MDSHLRGSIAVYNTDRFHAAHDAREDYWLDLDSDDDEPFLHGVIQFTAVVHHASIENWSGAESAGEYLADLPADYRGVNFDDVRSFLAQVADGPTAILVMLTFVIPGQLKRWINRFSNAMNDFTDH